MEKEGMNDVNSEDPIVLSEENSDNIDDDDGDNDSLLFIIFQSIIIFIFVASAGICFVLLFSAMTDIGPDVNDSLREKSEYYVPIASLGSLLFIFLWLFDASSWKSIFKYFGYFFYASTVGLLIIGAILSLRDYPLMPPTIFILGVPIYLYICRLIFYKTHNSNFLHRMVIPLAIASLSILWWWLLWVFYKGNYWDAELRAEYKVLMDCPVDKEYCLAAYLLWISPFVVSLGFGFFSVFALFLGKTLKKTNSEDASKALVRFFVFIVIIVVMGVWIGASIAGAETGMSTMVEMFAGAIILIASGLIVRTMGMQKIKSSMRNVAMIVKLQNVITNSDWVKAMCVLVFAVPYIFFLFFSLINQIIRRIIPCTRPLPHMWNLQSQSCVTHRVSLQLDLIINWNWSSVLYKVNMIGIAFIVVNVGVGKMTTLFFSWFIQVMDDVDLWIVYLVFLGVAIIMFLMPPIPGVPVYLAGGIIITQATQSSIGFVPAVCVAGVIAWLSKMIAVPMQQIGIGEMLGTRVGIRKMVGVNSITIRAIRSILSKPGFAFDKVCILVGGPDWPTSVLTGILKLSRVQMMLGTTPVIFLVIPTTMAGSFMLKVEEGGSWDSISSVTLAVAAMVQGAAMVSALFFIEKVAHEKGDELKDMPDDEEVKAAEIEDEIVQKQYDAATDFNDPTFPTLAKLILAAGALFHALSCYVLEFLECFKPYLITNTIEKDLDGNILNIVLPPGAISLYLFGVAVFLVFVFNMWVKCRVKDFKIDNADKDILMNPVDTVDK